MLVSCPQRTQYGRLGILQTAAHSTFAVAGAPPERLCAPLVEYFQARGGEVHLNKRLKEIELAEDGNVAGFRMADGSLVTGDLYVSAMPGGARMHL